MINISYFNNFHIPKYLLEFAWFIFNKYSTQWVIKYLFIDYINYKKKFIYHNVKLFNIIFLLRWLLKLINES